MCYTLGCEKVILNYFAQNREKRMLTIHDFNKLASRIVDACDNGIIVNVNRDSIADVLLKRSSTLSMTGHVIQLLDQTEVSEYKMNIVNNTIPESIRKHCISVCESYAK